MLRLPRFHLVLILALAGRAAAGGLYNPADARSAALGGEEAAQSGSVLSALDSNPAALATVPRASAAITLTGALLRGEIQEPGDHAALLSSAGFIASGSCCHLGSSRIAPRSKGCCPN